MLLKVITLIVLCISFSGNVRAEPSHELELLTVVQATLLKEPGIAIKRQELMSSNARHKSTQASFDTRLNLDAGYSRTNTPLDRVTKASYADIDSSIADSRVLRLELSKTFRQGLTLSPGIQISRSESALDGSTGKTQIPPITNSATLSFNFVQPILRGAGSVAVAGQERSAQFSAAATKAEFEYLLSQKVLQTTQAFWAYYAAFERVGMLKKTEKRAEQLTRETQILIDAAEWPAADIQQTKASLAQKKQSRIRAEQSLLAARHRLAMAMGLEFSEFDFLGRASKRYPKILSNTQAILDQYNVLAEFALAHRKDFVAKSFALKSAQVLALAASRNRLPELNLTGSLGYSGIQEGAKFERFGEALYTNVPGLNGSLNLVLNWPIENRFHDSAYLQARAAVTQSTIVLKDAERQIRSAIKLAITEVISSAEEVKVADFSARSFEIAVENEKKKLKAGLSTLIDLIQMENNAISARLSWIGALENYANSLVQLRHQLGSLIVIGDGSGQVTWETLTTIPRAEG